MEYAAVRLFVDRARTHHPDFALTRQNGPTVARICRRLDGIPLAIELAAARIRGMSVEAIDGRLDDRFRLLTGGSRTALARQQTLRATMDWSFDLLTAKERLLLPRLSIFAGGWTLEAAERVCPDGAIQEWEVLDGLMALVDKSLVVYDPYGRDGGRYRLLETVRQYAAERRDDPATGAKARHRDFFLELAETLEPRLKGAEQARSLEQLETEQENLRAALEYCQEEVNGAAAELRMVASLWQLWYMHGYASQGRRYLAHALNRDGAAERNERRGFVLNGAGVLAWQQGDYDSARALLNESLSIKRELNDKPGVAGAALNLGNLAYYQGDYSGARERYEESLALKRALGDRMGIALALGNIGMVAWNQGDYPTAQAQYEASRDLLRELGHEYALATVVQNLGLLARDQRDYGAARALFDESLEMRRELGDKQGISESLGHLGTVARAVKDYGAAEELYEESLSITRELGDRRGIAGCLMNLAEAATDVGELDRAAKLFEEGLELRRKLADKQGILTALEGAARLCVARGRARKAVPLWGAAEHLREEIGASLTPYDREQYERNVASAREAVEDVAFRNAWDDGRAMTIEEAIAAALDVIAG
jgi:tetratricopeptide (TPR) repeat protein